MKFTDIIDLAKAGYSPKDIKDLLALEPNSHEQDPGPEGKPAPDPLPEDDKDKIIEDLKKQIAENELKLKESEVPPNEEVKPDPRDAEIEELKKKIATFQAAELKKDISGSQMTDDDRLKETVRKFM